MHIIHHPSDEEKGRISFDGEEKAGCDEKEQDNIPIDLGKNIGYAENGMIQTDKKGIQHHNSPDRPDREKDGSRP